jgi:integrase/recombinase XerC
VSRYLAEVDQQIAAFADALRALGRSPFTVDAYIGDLRGLAGHAGAAAAADVTSEQLAAFVLSAASRATQRRRLSSAASFFRWAQSAGLAPSNPAVDVERPAPPPLVREVLSRAELKCFVEAVGAGVTDFWADYPLIVRDVALVHLLARGGLQAGEALALDTRDVSFVGSVALVTVRGRRERQVRIGGLGAKALRALLEALPRPPAPLFRSYSGQRMEARSLDRRLIRWSAAAGLDIAVTPRILRNTLARHLQEDGTSAVDVARLLGHASPGNTILAVLARPRRARRRESV